MSKNAFSESSAVYSLIEKIVSKIIEEKTRACFRVYKAIVVSAPNGTTCGVSLAGENTTLNIPYSSRVSDIVVGDSCLVGVVYNNFRNAVVWEKTNFS